MDRKILYHFFEGTVSPKEKKTIKSWLDADPEHEDTLRKEREFFDMLIMSGSIHDVRKEKGNVRLLLWRRVVVEVMKIAAVVAIVLGCGYYFHTEKMETFESLSNTITVPVGQRVNLLLSDGTTVWLNARSTMTYPATFSDSNREVVLTGEAYFDVKPDKDRPFVVHTGKYDVEVLGTKFNVETYTESEDFSTALIEGSVRIVNVNDPVDHVLLTPNNRAYTKNGHLVTHQIEDYDLFRWREGLICFKNVSFDELMLRFEKCYGIRIIIRNPAMAEHVFSGKFRISDGVDNALRILQKDAGYTFTRNQDESEIYIE